MKVALVYDRVNKIGGAEKIILALHEIWPQAPLYTAVYDPAGAEWSKNITVIPSFIQKLPFAKKSHEFFPWLTPVAFKAMNFDKFDVLISVTSAEAKSVQTKPNVLHICYCLTPTRYLWSGSQYYSKNPGFGLLNFAAKPVFALISGLLRSWDLESAGNPDVWVAISQTVRERIKKYYRRESTVIYPPVETSKFRKGKNGDYFLVVSRLVPYKRVDIIIKAFNELGRKLKVVGSGNQLAYLKSIARGNIEFTDLANDEELIKYYQNCRALVISADEDFGLTALEAQAAGKPVIAYGKGGVTETVIANSTGLFYNHQTAEDLKLALCRFDKLQFNPSVCIKNASGFSKEIFIKKFKSFVEEQWQKHQDWERKQ